MCVFMYVFIYIYMRVCAWYVSEKARNTRHKIKHLKHALTPLPIFRNDFYGRDRDAEKLSQQPRTCDGVVARVNAQLNIVIATAC